jgi:Icc-related predicted phosphoesterase
MRIVAISDTHGRHRELEVPAGDLLVHAGDFTSRGGLGDVEEFDDWIGQFDHPHKLVVAGNCDGCFEQAPSEARSRLTQARYLQDERIEIDGLTFWGSPWQPVFLNMAFNVPRGDALAEKWASMPDDTDVLITHGPPAGVLDETSRGETVGDEALWERVRQVQPDLHVFGHVHESTGRRTVGKTTFINAACNEASDEAFVVEVGE